jgi:hypothetical protein
LAGGALTCSVSTALAYELFALWDALACVGVFFPYDRLAEDSCPYHHQFWNESIFGVNFATTRIVIIVAPSLAAIALFLSLAEFAGCRFTTRNPLPILFSDLYFVASMAQADMFLMYFLVKNTWYLYTMWALNK